MEVIEKIFIGGMEEFKENGIKFTMDGLAKRVGISKRTLYEAVASKSALLDLVIQRTFEDIKRQQHTILSDITLNTLEKLKKMLVIIPIYSNLLDYRRIAELKIPFPSLYKKVMEKLESDWDPTIMLIEKAMDEGVIKKINVIVLKMLLCEIFENLIQGETLINNNISYETAMQEMISIVFDGILVEPEK